MLTHLDLFSGVGGFTRAAELVGGIQTTQFVEIDPDAQATLRSRFPGIPIHANICDYSPRTREFDLATVGFPCTGTSAAGLRTGLDHPESALWFEALRCIADGQPRFVVIENPPGVISRGLRAILGGLRVVGYCWDDPQIISAAELGAPQERKRLFVVAYPNYLRQRFREVPTSWSDQIGAEIEAVHQSWGQVKSSSTRVDDGLPRWLGGRSVNGWWAENPAPSDCGIRRYTPKRRECNNLYARSVVPEVAAIALRRVLYLSQL
ncbi:DNA (cytosine-5-)-methyltransferase [Cyanosarcina cf. burmensis CCALA 770]|nr:DNA (cytosine-5-)-methyltransferase [Cyanosarcina cf. burmensis CCALA 770]